MQQQQAQIPVNVPIPLQPLPQHNPIGSLPLPDLSDLDNSNGDPRLHALRKLTKTLKPAVLLKSWQRVCMLVAGIETSHECGQASIATLEKEIYDRYHGNIHRDPPIIGTVKRAMDDQLDVLAADKFGIKFPRDKVSYMQMTAGMPGHTIWRYYKELITEVTNKINLVYRSCLREDYSFPDGKALYDVLEDTLRILWTQNEETRKERATKRLDEGGSHLDDSDSDMQHESSLIVPMNGGQHEDMGRKRTAQNVLLSTKAFPGVGRFQPIAFLTFLLLGPPAGEKCWARFGLDAHLEPQPPHHTRQQRMSTGRSSRMDPDDMNLDDLISPRGKRIKTGMDEENEAIRIFNAETTARSQRLEELKLALSLFPDDESIKAELKQFVDTQRRTSLTSEQHQFANSLPPMFC